METYTFAADNSYLSVKWKSCYNGVFFANNLINVAKQVETELTAVPGQSKDYFTETIAQARFFRAFWHFEVVKLFGAAVPYVNDEDVAANVNPQVSNVDESGNYIYIWDKIAEDSNMLMTTCLIHGQQKWDVLTNGPQPHFWQKRECTNLPYITERTETQTIGLK